MEQRIRFSVSYPFARGDKQFSNTCVNMELLNTCDVALFSRKKADLSPPSIKHQPERNQSSQAEATKRIQS